MKRMTVLLAAVLAVAWVAAMVTAQDGQKVGKEGERKDAQPKPKLYGEQAKLAEVAGLSEEQQTRIAELNIAREKEVREVYAKYNAQVMAVMTDEQKVRWNGHVVVTTFQRTFAKAALTEEQLAKIKGAIPTFAPDGVPADEKGRSDLMRKMWDYVVKEVLTDEQRTAMHMPPKREPEKRAPEKVNKEGDNPKLPPKATPPVKPEENPPLPPL